MVTDDLAKDLEQDTFFSYFKLRPNLNVQPRRKISESTKLLVTEKTTSVIITLVIKEELKSSIIIHMYKINN